MGNEKFITVGIPTYNSSIYLKQCLDSIKGPKVINEILISDDGSNESELLKIKEIVSIYQSKYSLNITFFESEKNMGAYRNKLKLIENSKNEYIYILDSDNLASKNLESVINKILKIDNPKFLYQPNIMYQFWKYHNFAKLMSRFDKKYIVKFFNEDFVLDKRIVQNFLLINSGDYELSEFKDNLPEIKKTTIQMVDKWVFWILNCGNFIVNKDYMLPIANKGLEIDRKHLSVDAIVFSYLWLENGLKIKIFKEFNHHHRKREDSVSFVESRNSVNAIRFFISKVLDF
jgi:glycosyltransferase involved in cell wall biosynthesis